MARVEFNVRKEEANSLRGWSLPFNHWRFTTDIISPIAQRFHIHIHVSMFTFSLYPRFVQRHYIQIRNTFLESHWPLAIVHRNDLYCKRD